MTNCPCCGYKLQPDSTELRRQRRAERKCAICAEPSERYRCARCRTRERNLARRRRGSELPSYLR
jgi:hypothetical protein